LRQAREKHLRAYISVGCVEPLVCHRSEARARALRAQYGVECVLDHERALSRFTGELDAVYARPPSAAAGGRWQPSTPACARPARGPSPRPPREAREMASASRRSLQVMAGSLRRSRPAVRFVEVVDGARGLLNEQAAPSE